MSAALATEDAAVAIAMAHCLTARTLDPKHRLTDRHPAACGWCDYPTDELRAAVEEFNAWAAFDDRHRTTGRHATRAFTELRDTEREALVIAAQALTSRPWGLPEPEKPAEPPDPVPAITDVDEERMPWFR
jgi:hypothetical protein